MSENGTKHLKTNYSVNATKYSIKTYMKYVKYLLTKGYDKHMLVMSSTVEPRLSKLLII